MTWATANRMEALLIGVSAVLLIVLLLLLQQSNSAASELSLVQDRVDAALLEGGSDRLEEVVAEVEQARNSEPESPFPTRAEVAQRRSSLNGLINRSAVTLTTPPVLDRTSDEVGGDGARVYSGEVITMRLMGSTGNLLDLMDDMQRQFPGLIFDNASFVTQGLGEGLLLNLTVVMYHSGS